MCIFIMKHVTCHIYLQLHPNAGQMFLEASGKREKQIVRADL